MDQLKNKERNEAQPLNSHKEPEPESNSALANKVLLVEDNPLNQKVLGMFISKLGFEHDTASNGQMAVDLAIENHYRFILMDIYMPGMDGTEATAKIREHEEGEGLNRSKIIAITANESDESVKRCYDSGMDDYLVKPFTLEILKEKLV
ncbi:MAG: response regulator [Prolixibacteraceae bacterium]|nr:response regulator [Prolixibacteraceae bacterium]